MAARSAAPVLAVAILCSAGAMLGGAPIAVAQTTPPPAPADAPSDTTGALQLYEQSKEAYRAGQFDQAALLLQRAYALSPQPVLLYNLARAYEGSGRIDQALDAYRRYLQADANPPDRGAIEERCTTLQREIEQRAALQRQRDEQAQRAAVEAMLHREAVERAKRRSPLPWVVLGVGLASVAAGVTLGLVAESQHGAAVDDSKSGLDAQSKQSTAQSLATGANVCFVAGGIVAAGGALWAFLDARRAARATSGSLYVTPTIGGLLIGRAF